jgi:Esterase/lipase
MSPLSLAAALMLPFTTPTYDVTVEQDVPYATVDGYYTHAPVGKKSSTFKLLFHSGIPKPVTLEMDIYTPAGAPDTTRPLLLMMHGGSFFIGNKAEPGQAGWCRYFASLGYVAVSIDYRLGYHLPGPNSARPNSAHWKMPMPPWISCCGGKTYASTRTVFSLPGRAREP